ncbi:MAG: TonB-dependent receptor, partial [Methylocystis sp.]
MTRILKSRKRNVGAVKAGVSVVTLLLLPQGAHAQTNLPPITIGANGADGEGGPESTPAPQRSGPTPKRSPIIGVVPDAPSTTYRV